jgi:CDP-paratose 2-epimerase
LKNIWREATTTGIIKKLQTAQRSRMPEYHHILVTGGAGFAGSRLALRLKQAMPGARVSVLDNLKRRGSELNLTILQDAGIEFIHGDIRSLEDLLAIQPAPDLIVECSAEASVLAGYGGSPEYLIRTNLLGCFHCLELARRSQADFIFVSTSRVYPIETLNGLPYREDETRYSLTAEQTVPGASEHGVSERLPLDGVRSLYGMTKLAGELMVQEYAEAYGLRYVINRCGLLTGPGQMAKSDQGVVALWVAAHHFGRRLRYIGFGGEGKQVRDFLHIDDFGDLMLDQLDHFDLYGGRAWNVGGGSPFSLSLQEMTAVCREVTGKSIPVETDTSNRPADIRIYISDSRAVQAVRGWQPKRDAVATISDIHEWMVREQTRLSYVL